MPYERSEEATWGNVRQGLQSMPADISQNALGLPQRGQGRTLPTSPLRAGQGQGQGTPRGGKPGGNGTGGDAGDGSQGSLMAERKGTVHFSGVNAFNRAVNKLKMIRAVGGENKQTPKKREARTKIHDAMLTRRSQFVNQTEPGKNGRVGVKTAAYVLFCLANVTPLAMQVMLAVHGLTYFSARGISIPFMLLTMAVMRAFDAWFDIVLGVLSDRLPADAEARRRTLLFVGAVISSVSFWGIWDFPRSLTSEPAAAFYGESTLHILSHLYYFFVYFFFDVGLSFVLIPLEALGVEFLDGYDMMEDDESPPRFLMPEDKVANGETEGHSRIRFYSVVGACRAFGCLVAMCMPLWLSIQARDSPPLKGFVYTNASTDPDVELYCKCTYPPLYKFNVTQEHDCDSRSGDEKTFCKQAVGFVEEKWVPKNPYGRELGEQSQIGFAKNHTTRFKNYFYPPGPTNIYTLDLFNESQRFINTTNPSESKLAYSYFTARNCHLLHIGRQPLATDRLNDLSLDVCRKRSTNEACIAKLDADAVPGNWACTWDDQLKECQLDPLETALVQWCREKQECEMECERVTTHRGFLNFTLAWSVLHFLLCACLCIAVDENEVEIVISTTSNANSNRSAKRNRTVVTESHVSRPGFGGVVESINHMRQNWSSCGPWAWGCFYDWAAMISFLVMLPFYFEYTVRPQEVPECVDGGGRRASPFSSSGEKADMWCTSAPFLVISFASFFGAMMLGSLVLLFLIKWGGAGKQGYFSVIGLFETEEEKLCGKQLVWRRYSLAVIVAVFIFSTCAHSAGDPAVASFLSAIVGFPSAAIVLHSVILADIVECDEFRTGQRAEGRYTSLLSLTPKVASLFATIVPFGMMYLLGFKRPPQGRFIDGAVVRGDTQTGTTDGVPIFNDAGIDSYFVVRWAMEKWVLFLMTVIPVTFAWFGVRAKNRFPIFMSSQMWHIIVGNALHLEGEAAVDPITRRIHVLFTVDREEENLFKRLCSMDTQMLEMLQRRGGTRACLRLAKQRVWKWAAISALCLVCGIVAILRTYEDRQLSWTALFALFLVGPMSLRCYVAVRQHKCTRIVAERIRAGGPIGKETTSLLDRYVVSLTGMDAERHAMERNRCDMMLEAIEDDFWCTEKDEDGLGKKKMIDHKTMIEEERIHEHAMRFQHSVKRKPKDTVDLLTEAVQDLMPLTDTLQGVVTDNKIYWKNFRELEEVHMDRDELNVGALMEQVHQTRGRKQTVDMRQVTMKNKSRRELGGNRALV